MFPRVPYHHTWSMECHCGRRSPLLPATRAHGTPPQRPTERDAKTQSRHGKSGGNRQFQPFFYNYNALGHVRRFVRRVWHDRNASKSSKVELDRIFPILEPAFFHDFGRSARFAGETGVKNCAESVLTEARRVASASVDRLMPTSPGTPGRS